MEAAKWEQTFLNQCLMLCVARCVDPIDFKRSYLHEHAQDDAEILQFLSKGEKEPPRAGDELPSGIIMNRRFAASNYTAESVSTVSGRCFS